MSYTWKINKVDGSVQLVSTALAMTVQDSKFEKLTVGDGSTDVDITRYIAEDAASVWRFAVEAAYEAIAAFPKEFGYPTGGADKEAYLLVDTTKAWDNCLASQNDEGGIPAYDEVLAYAEGLINVADDPGAAESGENAKAAFVKAIDAAVITGGAAGQAELRTYMEENGIKITKKHIYLFIDAEES